VTFVMDAVTVCAMCAYLLLFFSPLFFLSLSSFFLLLKTVLKPTEESDPF